MDGDTNREAVGVFDGAESLQNAADELMVAGFDRSELSLLAGHRAVEEKLGHMYTKVVEVEDDPEAPHTAYVGSDSRTEAESAIAGGLAYVGAVAAAGAIVASGGTIAGAIVATVAAGGAGGLIGSVLARIIERHHANHLQEQLDRGGLLLWVRVHDAVQEQRACEIMRRWSAEDVHAHDLPESEYTFEGGVSYETSFMKTLGM